MDLACDVWLFVCMCVVYVYVYIVMKRLFDETLMCVWVNVFFPSCHASILCKRVCLRKHVLIMQSSLLVYFFVFSLSHSRAQLILDMLAPVVCVLWSACCLAGRARTAVFASGTVRHPTLAFWIGAWVRFHTASKCCLQLCACMRRWMGVLRGVLVLVLVLARDV